MTIEKRKKKKEKKRLTAKSFDCAAMKVEFEMNGTGDALLAASERSDDETALMMIGLMRPLRAALSSAALSFSLSDDTEDDDAGRDRSVSSLPPSSFS